MRPTRSEPPDAVHSAAPVHGTTYAPDGAPHDGGPTDDGCTSGGNATRTHDPTGTSNGVCFARGEKPNAADQGRREKKVLHRSRSCRAHEPATTRLLPPC